MSQYFFFTALLILLLTNIANAESQEPSINEFIERLKDYNLLDKTTANTYFDQLKNGEKFTIEELLIETKIAKFYSRHLDTNVTAEKYAQLLDELDSLNNELNISNISGEYMIGNEYSWREYFLMKFDSNKTKYETTIPFLGSYNPNYISSDFYETYNQVLADINSSKRYYSLDIDENSFGIMLLDKQQADFLTNIKDIEGFDLPFVFG